MIRRYAACACIDDAHTTHGAMYLRRKRAALTLRRLFLHPSVRGRRLHVIVRLAGGQIVREDEL